MQQLFIDVETQCVRRSYQTGSANSTVLPSKTVLRTTILDSVVLFECGQRNSLKTINVDGEHFIRFRGKSCFFKFIQLSVDVA